MLAINFFVSSSYTNKKLFDFPLLSKTFSHVFSGFQMQVPLPLPFGSSNAILFTSSFSAEYSTTITSLLYLRTKSCSCQANHPMYHAIWDSMILQSHQSRLPLQSCYRYKKPIQDFVRPMLHAASLPKICSSESVKMLLHIPSRRSKPIV